MNEDRLELAIKNMNVLARGPHNNFLAYFDCDFGIVELRGCILLIRPHGEIIVSGPLTKHKEARVAYISRPMVFKAMITQALPQYVKAGGIIPEGTFVSASNRDGGALDEYLH